jgi:hypothetical protein
MTVSMQAEGSVRFHRTRPAIKAFGLALARGALRTIRRMVHEALVRGLTLAQTQKTVNLTAVRLSVTHGDPDLNAVFDGNFTPIVKQMYDEATEGPEQYR